MARGSFAWRRLMEYLDASRDNFERDVSNPLTDLIDVAGEKSFTPERLEYFKDGSRVFLQYGSDNTFAETDQGHQLTPNSGQTLELRTAEKVAYQVGYDLWPTQSYQVLGGPLQTGDVVGGGYGRIDLANFDPETITYTGSTADGFFWYHTADTGLDSMELAEVQKGTVLDNRSVEKQKKADVFSIIEQRLNWYAVGPSVFREVYTDVGTHPDDPQQNRVLGGVANDDGKSSAEGSHRQTFAIHQAAGNSGLEMETGSIGIRAPGPATPQFKAKSHTEALENTNTTDGTYEVCGAIRIDTTREESKLRFSDVAISNTPGASVNEVECLIIAVHPDNTDADTKTFSVPEEQSKTNSVLRSVTDNTITGPVEDDPDTDSTGATTSNTMADPGGYQLGRAKVTAEGTGSKTQATAVSNVGNRELYPGLIALLLIDSTTAGTTELEILSEQNS